jgi:hypothetical protein
MKYKHISLYLFLFLFSFSVKSQNKNKEGFYYTPDMFNTYCRSKVLEQFYSSEKQLDEFLKSTNKNKTTLWEVYSDRKKNPLYSSPNNSRRKPETLDFMEPLRIKSINNNWINVYKQNKEKEYVDVGWINVENVILTSYAILGEKGIPRKAMALISLKGTPIENSNTNFKNYDIYYDPSLLEKKQLSGEFDIYYILKESKGAKLLSRVDVLNKGSQETLSEAVSGWLGNSFITNWDHRTCLEQAYNRVAVQEYQSRSIPIFLKKDKLDKFIDLGNTNSDGAIMRYDLTNELPSVYTMRMPILNNFDSKLKEVATVGNRKGEISKKDDDNLNLKEKASNLRNKLENINILFVIDATQSMKLYYDAVSDALSTIIRDAGLSKDGTTFKYGLVTYRDYADGDGALNIIPVTKNGKEIINALNTTICKSLDSDLPEAQYNALINGVKNSGLKKGESNVVVLIGDAGNHRDDVKYKFDEAIGALVEYKINLIAFQVTYNRHSTYSDFNKDVRKMLIELAKRSNKNPKLNTSLKKVQNIENSYKIEFLQDDNSPGFQYSFGRFTHASDGSAMSPKVLEKSIKDAILIEYIPLVESKNLALDKLILNGSNSKISRGQYTEDVLNLIAEANNWPPEVLARLNDPNNGVDNFSFVGYTAMKFYDNNSDCFQPVVFLSDKEISDLSKVFNELRITDNKSDQRDKFKDALLTQAKLALGIENEQIILNKTLNEVWDVLIGVEFDANKRYKNLGNTKLRDLDKIPSSDLKEFFARSSNTINSFDKQKYKNRRFELTNNNYFYWVPLSDIPGNEK